MINLYIYIEDLTMDTW